ncbi:MAG: hypothetical protein KF716_11135 [Anaerolineae bacterium]|nr:hypothetical protein [Anaerolineae bacterium]
MQKRTLVRLFTLVACLAAWSVATPTATQAQGTETITLTDASIVPQSVIYDAAAGTFLVGSTAKGTIYAVAPDGSTTAFIEDSEMTATVGMYLDTASNKLYVVDSSIARQMLGRTRGGFGGRQPSADGTPQAGNPPNGQQPSDGTPQPGGQPPTDGTSQPGQPPTMGNFNATIALFVFDLNTKQRVLKADLTTVAAQQGLRLAYDVALDKDGNAYVTDSMAGAVYRIDPQGTLAYLSDPKFQTMGMMGGAPGQGDPNQNNGQGGTPSDQGGAPGQGGFGRFGGLGLTGIVYHPDGYLILAQASDGKLFKIPLDNPQNVTEITLPEAVTGARGITLTADGKLLVATSQEKTVYVISSADQWATATIDKKITVEIGASDITLKDGEVWVLESGTAAAQTGSDQTTPTVSSATLTRIALN